MQAVMARVVAFLAYILPDNTPVVQGDENRVPAPVGGYVVITSITQKRLATNISHYADPSPTTGTRTVEMKTGAEVQIDCYGPLAEDWAAMIVALWRDEQGCELLAPDCAPLYADDATHMTAYVNGEAQFEPRWMVRANLAYNGLLTLPQQFADQAAATVINVDVEYPAS